MNMTNLEIARVFNVEEDFKQNVLEHLAMSDGSISMGYVIYVEEYESLTEEQQEVWDEYNNDCGEIELVVDIDLDELLG